MNKTSRAKAVAKVIDFSVIPGFIENTRNVADKIEDIYDKEGMPNPDKLVAIFDTLVEFGLASDSELKPYLH
jgi:hypothetical protein